MIHIFKNIFQIRNNLNYSEFYKYFFNNNFDYKRIEFYIVNSNLFLNLTENKLNDFYRKINFKKTFLYFLYKIFYKNILYGKLF